MGLAVEIGGLVNDAGGVGGLAGEEAGIAVIAGGIGDAAIELEMGVEGARGRRGVDLGIGLIRGGFL